MQGVEIPETVIDKIKDFRVHLKSLHVILDDAEDGTSQEVREEFSKLIVFFIRNSSHLIEGNRLWKVGQILLETCIDLHRELLSLHLLSNVRVDEVLDDIRVQDLARDLRLDITAGRSL